MTTAWSQSTVSLIKDLGTSQSSGLTEKEVMVRQTRLGKNVLKTQKTSSQLALIARQFNNPMTYTLMVATVIAFSMGELLDAMAILAIVIMNAGISYAQESKAEAAIQSLKKLTVPKARVLREGGIRTIDSVDVLPGDILQLEAGDYVVADARVIEAYQLAADESVLTGESMPVEKNSEPV